MAKELRYNMLSEDEKLRLNTLREDLEANLEDLGEDCEEVQRLSAKNEQSSLRWFSRTLPMFFSVARTAISEIRYQYRLDELKEKYECDVEAEEFEPKADKLERVLDKDGA